VAELRERLQAALGAAYGIEKELGGGGMSRVFLAEETELGRKVVVKVLPPEMAAGVNAERFRREIQLAARLQHPHIVPLLTAGSSGDLLYYVMPHIEGQSLRARLAHERELPIGEAGQILLRGGFMPGYWRRPEATEATLKGGWLHTGDVGKMDEEGNLYLLTRVSERIVSGGRALYPRLLEEALLRHPAVHRAAVFGLPDPALGQLAKAAVSLHSGKAATEAELMAHCRKELADGGPHRLEILAELPMTPTGKISKMDLLARERTLAS